MNCPRCTQEIPEGSRYCPACGLDLEKVGEETPAGTQAGPYEPAGEEFELEESAAAETPAVGLWPSWLRIHPTRTPKRPMLAATLAFFFGPFAYLYVEQATWFWWGLLGGVFLIILSRAELIPLLVIGFILHAYDVAVVVNRQLEEDGVLPVDSEQEQI